MRCCPWCEQHGLAVTAYSPFGHGDFPGPDTSGGRLLAEIARAHDATARQVALAFLRRRPSVSAIPKASSVEHVEENEGASDADVAGRDRANRRRISARSPPARVADDLS